MNLGYRATALAVAILSGNPRNQSRLHHPVSNGLFLSAIVYFEQCSL